MQRLLATRGVGIGEAKSIERIPSLNDGEHIIKFKVKIIDLPGPTRNGVLYPLEEFKKAINDSRITQMLKTGSLYGEDDHPIDPSDLVRWTRIEMKNATHKWNKLWFEGSSLWGECQTYPGNGNLLALAIKSGELPSFSIRVVGNPQQQGEYTQLNDITLISIDWVRYPGNPSSYVPTSDAFEIEKAPLYSGFDLATREIAKAEANNALGIDSNKAIYSLGYGHHAIVDKIDRDAERNLFQIRSNSF